MKKLIYFLVFFSLFSCKTTNKHNQVLTDQEWRPIIFYTFAIDRHNDHYIFKDYDNKRLRDIISFTYTNSQFFGYKFNDSILNYINTRENKPITNRLDTMYNIKIINDTISYNNYLIYSEPFYANNKILCIAMLRRNANENTTLQKVFFFEKKKNEPIIILGYYNVNKDMYMRRSF